MTAKLLCLNKNIRLHLNDYFRERSLFIVLEDITTRCQKHNIKKNIIDDAKLMYKKISECQHLKGKNKDKFIIIRGSNRKSLIAACVFYACKLNNNTQSPKEVAKIFDLKITEITKGCKKFLQLIRNYNSIYKLKSSTPVDFIKRYCNILNIHAKDAELAMLIANNIKKLGLASDHTPPSVAAGSILLMSKINNLSLTKKSISKKFSISEVTISKIYKKIEEYNKILVNTEQTEQFVLLINSQT
jgi:transcription initiation factor TFIIIB Brf1 subunit/transcription initiation factor TFIIB